MVKNLQYDIKNGKRDQSELARMLSQNNRKNSFNHGAYGEKNISVLDEFSLAKVLD